ncbi:MAG TPA: hypothetical protein VJL29_08255 [Thermoguttaceae bacterium]|nr:hypothetical protein [Thermoguttaceae bacterium]
MATSARLTIGTVQSGVDRRPVTWALMETLRRRDITVQDFASRACFCDCRFVTALTGLKPRYLDSWLMDEAVCRELFVHGSQMGDLSLVEGTFDLSEPNEQAAGGRLETLCRWLRLPRVVLLDASRIADALPRRPERVDGVFLDNVTDERRLARLTTDIETVWRVGVLGSLPSGGDFGRRIAGLPPGGDPPKDLVRELGNAMERSWHPEALLRLAQAEALGPVDAKLFRVEPSSLRLTVAVAFDEAFDCYFPCMLDMLEARGATIVDFSPLHDECLPADCDIVLLGGGHPERFGPTLSDNHCMKTSLRNHVRWGRRIYGEGGGLSLLCQQMMTPDGRHHRMAGLLPAIARAVEPAVEAAPVEATFARSNWLGHAGTRIRGYRNGGWALEPSGRLDGFLAEDEHHLGMMGSFQTVGSLLEIHFGAQANLLNHFFYPHMPSSTCADPWRHG